MTDRGFGEGTMGGIMSAIGAAWVFWGVAVPAISDRLGRKPTLIFFAAGGVLPAVPELRR